LRNYFPENFSQGHFLFFLINLGITLGRKNWLFFGSPESGQSAAVLLSLVQTCRGLEINPREYLEDVFRRLSGHNQRKIEDLLPDQWQQARKSLL